MNAHEACVQDAWLRYQVKDVGATLHRTRHPRILMQISLDSVSRMFWRN
jgi:hypothetical protein